MARIIKFSKWFYWNPLSGRTLAPGLIGQTVSATSMARISGSSLPRDWEMNYTRNLEFGAVWIWTRVHHLSNLIKHVVGRWASFLLPGKHIGKRQVLLMLFLCLLLRFQTLWPLQIHVSGLSQNTQSGNIVIFPSSAYRSGSKRRQHFTGKP